MMISEAEVRREREHLERELAGDIWRGEEEHIKSFIDALDFVLSEGQWAEWDER